VQISVYYILSCTVVLVLGCNWPFLAVVKHVYKLIELNCSIEQSLSWKADCRLSSPQGTLPCSQEPTIGLPSGFFPSGLPTKIFYAFFVSIMLAHGPRKNN
jgi:hypothetical protein